MYDIQILGLLRLNRRLDNLAPDTQNGLRTFLTVFLPRLKDQVKSNISILFNRGLVEDGGRFKWRDRLYNSIETSQVNEGSSVVGSVFSRDVPYAGIQEHGGHTGAHVILPRTASVLAFEGPVGLMFAKTINHPGSNIPGRSYAGLALVQMRGEFRSGIREVVSEVTRP